MDSAHPPDLRPARLQDVFFLPQKPFMPLGNLRRQLLFPSGRWLNPDPSGRWLNPDPSGRWLNPDPSSRWLNPAHPL